MILCFQVKNLKSINITGLLPLPQAVLAMLSTILSRPSKSSVKKALTPDGGLAIALISETFTLFVTPMATTRGPAAFKR